MTLKRKDHWSTQSFHPFLIERAAMPFTYGIRKQDCCSFSVAGIEAMTGVFIADDFPDYSTEKGALKAIRKVCGGKSVEDAATYCAKKYEMPELPTPLHAQRGDMVLIVDGDDQRLGLVHLNGRDVVVPGADGLLLQPLTLAKRAWRVG